jgi:hypothetical protein
MTEPAAEKANFSQWKLSSLPVIGWILYDFANTIYIRTL